MQMNKFRKVTDDFYVAPQLQAEDVDAAWREGFQALIMNRPDGESQDQPQTSDIVSRAEEHGMAFKHIPITAPPQPADVQATSDALDAFAGQKVLAFCRSGTRSVTLWAYAKVARGELSADQVIRMAADAGYDLSPHGPVLESIAR